ncbi:hypothetical protein ACFWJW_04600 [Streptomyces sp. NPDC127097]|uniref:hypothetical protein n=1 Tax=Streptomyces sp. NPDC127097 TaxID=3347136 RepID=UPI00364FF344
MMHETGPLTTASGALVADSRNSEQVGVAATPVPKSARRARGRTGPTRRAHGRTGLIRRRAAQAGHAAGYAALRRAA